MDRVEKFFSLLKAVTDDCKDDGTQFILPDRIEAFVQSPCTTGTSSSKSSD